MLPFSINPYLRKTCCPESMSSPVNRVVPEAIATLAGIGGASEYVLTDIQISNVNPMTMTMMTECRHQGESDVIEPGSWTI
jgi:hypothetical protein